MKTPMSKPSESQKRSALLNLFILAMLFGSLWVGANGLVFGQKNMKVCYANKYALEHLSWHVPEFSALFRPFVVSNKLKTKEIFILCFHGCLFLYLALPIFYQLLQSGSLHAKELKGKYLDIKKWTF